jgi:hypothetical protein
VESPTDRDALLARIEGWTYDRALGADVAGGTTTPAAEQDSLRAHRRRLQLDVARGAAALARRRVPIAHFSRLTAICVDARDELDRGGVERASDDSEARLVVEPNAAARPAPRKPATELRRTRHRRAANGARQ